MGLYNPVQARLRRDLEAHRQLGLPKHSPAALSVYIRAIRGSKNHRTTRFHSSLAFLKLISKPKSSLVIAK
jgi:hypothetical protein